MWSIFHVTWSWVCSCPNPQALDWAGKSCQGQTLELITKIRTLQTKKFYSIGPWRGKGSYRLCGCSPLQLNWFSWAYIQRFKFKIILLRVKQENSNYIVNWLLNPSYFWAAGFPQVIRIGPYLFIIGRSCWACWTQSLCGIWWQNFTYCCWSTWDFRPAALASPN